MQQLEYITKSIQTLNSNFKMSGIVLFCFVLIAVPNLLLAQQNNIVSIKASAHVIEKTEIELITIKDLEIDLSMAVKGVITINPLSDSQVGLIMLKGKPGAMVRITFLPRIELSNSSGRGSLIFEYRVFGLPENNQATSEPIDAIVRNVRFSDQGLYYLWIGGKIETKNARPGNYDGEFTLEIEYI